MSLSRTGFSTRLRLSWLLVVLVLASMSSAEEGSTGTVFRAELETLNGTFTDLRAGFVPIDRGGATILLRSPRHRITVHGHRLTLSEVPDSPPGTYDVWLTVDLDGDGELEAIVQQTGTELKDRVVAPRQTVRMSSRLRLTSVDGGFSIEVVKPYLHTLDFRIESRLAAQIVSSCSGLSLFVGGLDCEALEDALGVARVPMPEAGQRFWLPAERLTEADRELLRSWAAVPAALPTAAEPQ
ncbi:MAG: hypothetical protein MPN21_19750 [Thermoanaerobaculia bacterium]|nr:hypothetical protein [Thermoanaerobaculia bacterium]